MAPSLTNLRFCQLFVDKKHRNPTNCNQWKEYDEEDDIERNLCRFSSFSSFFLIVPFSNSRQVISWFGTLIHHPGATSSIWFKVVFRSGSTCTANPAKLVPAQSTSHVVAASIFFNPGSTHWTKG